MKVKLINVCEVINGGAWTQSEYTDDGIGVIKVSNLKSSGIEGEISYLPVESLSKYEKHILDAYDLVVTTVGSHAQLKESAAGRSFIIPKDYEGFLLNQNAVCIRPKNGEVLDKRYLGFFGQSEEFRHYVQSLGRGAANQMRIAIGGIKKFEFELPPLPTQRRIAAILSAYDGLIENNLKRIRLLEEAAQNIYREWFVHFRFPGHERAEFGEDGLPVEWEKINLYDFANIQMGFAFKAKQFNDEKNGTPAIRIRDIPSNSTSTYTTEEVDEKYGVEQGDILIGMDGFFYTDIWAGQRGYLVQRVCRVRANDMTFQGFLLESLKAPIKYFEQTITGATVAHLGTKHLKQIDILVPDENLKSELTIFKQLHQQRVKLFNQITLLKEARDILLPRLMNRTIEV